MSEIRVQYGVRYGDGEIEGPLEDRVTAEVFVRGIRNRIKAGDYDPDEYEPMTIVRREMNVSLTDWLATTEPPPAVRGGRGEG